MSDELGLLSLLKTHLQQGNASPLPPFQEWHVNVTDPVFGPSCLVHRWASRPN